MTKRLKSILKIFIITAILLLIFTACGKSANKSEEENYTETAINENCLSEIIEKGKLVVGCKTDVPGLSYYDEKNGWSGEEIDLAYKIAAEIFGVSAEEAEKEGLVKLVPVTVADREEKLENSEIDIMLATYSITDERRKKFALSESYYQDYVGLMVRNSGSGNDPNSLGTSDIATISDLEGKYIGIAKNSTTREAFLKVINVSPIFCEYDSYEKLFKALKTGDIDAMAVDISILNGYVDNSTKILGVKFSRQDYGAAALKENEPLIEIANKVISEYKSENQ